MGRSQRSQSASQCHHPCTRHERAQLAARCAARFRSDRRLASFSGRPSPQLNRAQGDQAKIVKVPVTMKSVSYREFLGSLKPPRAVIRGWSSWTLQGVLERRGLGPVAGVDEAGRGPCAGPLVVASCVLRTGDEARFGELTDSKLLTAAARERVYQI